MGTRLPPIAKGVEATTNSLPIADDELIRNYESTLKLIKISLGHDPSKVAADLAAEIHKLKARRVSDSDAVDVAAVEAILGYTFKNNALLEEALTHTSFRPRNLDAEFSFKDLELLGDRAISHAVTRRHLCAQSKSSCSLTRLHSLNVDNEKLARAAVAHGLHRFLRHDMPPFQQDVDDFAEEIAGYPLHSNGQVRTPSSSLTSSSLS
jgi:hypothetical protein